MPKQQNSWPYVVDRCKLIFGHCRVVENNDMLGISFDLSSPAELDEHDQLLKNFRKKNIEWDSSISGKIPEGGVIVLPKNNTVGITIAKASTKPDSLNDSLLPLLYRAKIEDENGNLEFRYNQDPVVKTLNDLTGRAWVGVVPSPYATEKVYTPAVQDPQLSAGKRAEQEHILGVAFIPSERHPTVQVRDWIAHQTAVEQERELSPTTALHQSLTPINEATDSHLHRRRSDQTFVAEVRKAFAGSVRE